MLACIFLLLSSTSVAVFVGPQPKFCLTTSFWYSKTILRQSTITAASATPPPPPPSAAPVTRTATTTVASESSFRSSTTAAPLQWTEFYTPPSSSSSTSHPPVILLHGLLGSKRNFASLGSRLGQQLDSPRRILGVDLRNHGDNSEVCDSMSYQEMAYDVLAWLDQQQLKEVILVGHSMGGKVAQAMALLYPSRVAGLVVLDIAPVTYSHAHDPHWKAVEDILHGMHAIDLSSSTKGGILSKQELDHQLSAFLPDPALRAFVLTNYVSNRGWKIPLEHIVQQLHTLAGFDLQGNHHEQDSSAADSSKDLQYDGDVFIIHGGQSRFVRHAYMDAIAGYFPNHMLTTIRGAGHWVHAEAPDDTIALLKRYLDR